MLYYKINYTVYKSNKTKINEIWAYKLYKRINTYKKISRFIYSAKIKKSAIYTCTTHDWNTNVKSILKPKLYIRWLLFIL